MSALNEKRPSQMELSVTLYAHNAKGSPVITDRANRIDGLSGAIVIGNAPKRKGRGSAGNMGLLRPDASFRI